MKFPFIATAFLPVACYYCTTIHAWTTGRPHQNQEQFKISPSAVEPLMLSRRASISKILFTFSSLAIISETTLVQESFAEDAKPSSTRPSAGDAGTTTSNSVPILNQNDALSSFGKDLNSINFDAWADGGTGNPGGGGDEGGATPPDLSKAIDQSKKKRAVDPRTHG